MNMVEAIEIETVEANEFEFIEFLIETVDIFVLSKNKDLIDIVGFQLAQTEKEKLKRVNFHKVYKKEQFEKYKCHI